MAAIWKPTQAECDLIRSAARRAASGMTKLEPAIRCGDSVEDSMNIARVTHNEDWEGSELADFGTWALFRKGVPLTEDGRAVVDFYVQGRHELLTNVVAYYQGGELVEVRNTSGLNLLSIFGIAKHYVHPTPPARVVVDRELVEVAGVMQSKTFEDSTTSQNWTAPEGVKPSDVVVFAPVTVPTLKIDALLFKDRPMPAHCKLERRIVANLIAHLAFHGWSVTHVWDGDDREATPDMVSAMELVFNLDECRIYFSKDGHTHSVYLVLGNGVDCLADWGFSDNDADGFNAAMELFNTEDYE